MIESLTAFAILLLFSACSDSLEPDEFCYDWIEAACVAIDTCDDSDVYRGCIEHMWEIFPKCSEWSCNPGYVWSGHNAAQCVDQMPEVSCKQLEWGLLPKPCNHLCIER